MLALAVMLVGTASTLALDQLWLRSWAFSGQAFPIGQRHAVSLPKGRSLVYYESPFSVPTSHVLLHIWDPDGERILFLDPPVDDNNFRLLLGGWSGRAVCQLDLPTEGQYTFMCWSHNFLDDQDIPKEDRVVFAKSPDTVAEVGTRRRYIQTSGAALTLSIVAVCYLKHRRTLRGRQDQLAGQFGS